jgi:hypothetical protein
MRRQTTQATEAEPADAPVEIPGLDPGAVTQNYRLARLRRRERIERTMRSRHATIRFWAILVLLLSLTTYVAIVVWNQIQQLFGV